MSIGLTENDYIRFKHLLEYFVAHLEYIREYKDNTRGYNEYIKPILENFKRTGQGYKGFEIQNQISNWCEYKPYNRICITVRKDQYPNNGCYLHWEGTDINIIAKWNQEKTSIESLTIANIPKEVNENLNELGLYNNTVPNDNLINFFNTYIEAYSEKHSNTINKMEEYVNLLKSNHNLVLTGAPGTGKTYLAKQIAEKLTNTKYDDKENPQIKMVQFHPSYDYTDFVEGLRPTKNIGFERKDGVFKEFCKGVLSNNNSIGNNNLEVGDNNFGNEKDQLKNLVEEEYYKLIENIKEVTKTNEVFKIPMKSYYLEKNDFVNKDAYYCELIVKQGNNKGQEIICIKKKNGKFDSIYIKDILRGIKKYRTLDALENATTEDIFGKSKASYSWAILHHIYNEIFKIETSKNINKQFENSIILNSKPKENITINQSKEKNYVFIIDEINRGEISKIFGELFFSIDPGYRGEKGKVDTQYQNLLKDSDDIFKNGFYIPENVYIIGTMNDIDRSVESMDFAMRRRFAFKEITAESRIGMLNDMKTYIDDNTIEEAKNRLRNLNAAISNTEGLNSAYHIGPAYFLKLRNYLNDTDGGWNSLWENHIKGLLYEYLRGYENLDEKIEKLQEAYENDTEQTTACKEQRRKFWDNFINYSKKYDGLYKDSSPSDGNWIQKRVFTGGVNIKVVINQNKCYVELEILTKSKDDNKNIFDTLEKNKSDIQKEFGDKELKWLRMDNNKTSKIRIAEKKLSYIKQEDEENIFEHLFETSQLAKEVFTNYGKVLNLSPNDE